MKQDVSFDVIEVTKSGYIDRNNADQLIFMLGSLNDGSIEINTFITAGMLSPYPFFEPVNVGESSKTNWNVIIKGGAKLVVVRKYYINK
jgi:hypothetical protein